MYQHKRFMVEQKVIKCSAEVPIHNVVYTPFPLSLVELVSFPVFLIHLDLSLSFGQTGCGFGHLLPQTTLPVSLFIEVTVFSQEATSPSLCQTTRSYHSPDLTVMPVWSNKQENCPLINSTGFKHGTKCPSICKRPSASELLSCC